MSSYSGGTFCYVGGFCDPAITICLYVEALLEDDPLFGVLFSDVLDEGTAGVLFCEFEVLILERSVA